MSKEFNFVNNYYAEDKFDENLMKQIMNLPEIQTAFIKFAWVYYDKFMWNTYAWNEFDTTSIGKRIAEMVVNKALCEPVKVDTPNAELNKIIKSKLEEIHFDSTLAQALVHGMIDGDLGMHVERDAYSGKPIIKYEIGMNLIPLVYNMNGIVHKEARCSKEIIEEEITHQDGSKTVEAATFIKLTVEDERTRTSFLYKWDGQYLVPFDNMTPQWIRIYGNNYPTKIIFPKTEWFKRFAWVHTGRQDSKWRGTPFHNSFMHPLYQLQEYNRSYDYINEEFKYSPKLIAINEEVYDDSKDELKLNAGFNEKGDNRFAYLKKLDLDGKPMENYTTPIRVNEFYSKMKIDLQAISLSRGFNASALWLDIPPKEMTATESQQSNQETIATIKRVQASLKAGLKTIMYALISLWYKDGWVSREMWESIRSADDIDIQLSDTFFYSREQKIQLACNIANSRTSTGLPILPLENIIEDYFGYGKEKTKLTVEKCKQDYAKYVTNGFTQLQQQLMVRGLLNPAMAQPTGLQPEESNQPTEQPK